GRVAAFAQGTRHGGGVRADAAPVRFRWVLVGQEEDLHTAPRDSGQDTDLYRCGMPGDKRAPRVTVVIPTFNRASLLRESIESVLAQSFTDFELLVADNGSTDDTPRLVASIEDPRVGADRLETNIGMIGNLDRSLSMGTGPYLVVLHDDDLLHPRHLETTVAALDARPEVAFVHTAISFIDG